MGTCPFRDGEGCCGGCMGDGLRGRFFDPDGTPRGDDFSIDADLSSGEAVALPDGSFVVAHDHDDAGDGNIRLTRLIP